MFTIQTFTYASNIIIFIINQVYNGINYESTSTGKLVFELINDATNGKSSESTHNNEIVARDKKIHAKISKTDQKPISIIPRKNKYVSDLFLI
jgi:hypothetical protein